MGSPPGIGHRYKRSLLVAVLLVPMAVVLTNGYLTSHLDLLKSVVFIVLTAVLATVLFVHLFLRRAFLQIPDLVAGYVLFLLLSMVSLTWANHTYDTSLTLSFDLGTVIMLIAVTNLVTTNKDLYYAVGSVAATVLIVSVVGFLEHAGLVLPFGHRSGSTIVSTLGNSAYAGGYLNTALPATWSLLLISLQVRTSHRRWWPIRASLAIISVCGIVALVLTASRSGIIGNATALVLFGLASGRILRSSPPRGDGQRARSRGFWIIIATFVFLAVAGIVTLLSDSYLQTKFGPLVDPTKWRFDTIFETRVAAWETAIRIWLSRGLLSLLFGRGLGSYYALGSLYFPGDFRLFWPVTTFKNAHNEYLELLADGGLVSLLAWLSVVVLAVFYAVRVIRNTEAGPRPRLIAAGILAAIAGTLVQSTADLNMRTTAVEATFYLLLGLSYANWRIVCGAAGNNVERNRLGLIIEPLTFGGRPVFVVGGVLMGALLAAGLAVNLRSFMSDYYLLRAARSPTPAKITQNLDTSIAWDGQDIYALYEELVLRRNDPAAAIKLADRVEAAIPGYRQAAQIKGLSQIAIGHYANAIMSLERYWREDYFDPVTSMNLFAAYIMLSNRNGALATLKKFFLRQNNLLMKLRSEHMGLSYRKLELTQEDTPSGLRIEGGRAVAVLSVPYLSRIISSVSQRRADGFRSVLATSYAAVASLFDELSYGDVSLAYYNAAIATGQLDRRSEQMVLSRYESFYDQAKELLAEGRAAGSPAIERRADHFLREYLLFMLAIRDTKAWRQELAGLPSDVPSSPDR